MKHTFFTLLFALALSLSGYAQDLVATVTHESTHGANDGAIDLTLNGGYAPYEFKWEGPNGFSSDVQNISNLAPGQYCVTVTDALCGTATLCEIVRRCDPILAAGAGVNCPYNSNGYMFVLLSGRGPFTLDWSDGTTQTEPGPLVRREGLDVGVYCVTVTNAAGCSEQICRNVFSPIKPIQITDNITQPICSVLTGSISLVVTGGVSPYTYLWDNNSSTKDRSGLSPGSYCVTVTDKKGCTQTSCFVVVASGSGGVKISLTNLSMISQCSGEPTCDGMISVQASGGTAPFQFSWSGPNGYTNTHQNIEALCTKGTYFVTVRDVNGCTGSLSVPICCCNAGDPPPGGCTFNQITLTADWASATNTQGGSINLYVQTGAAPYTLVWKKNGQFYSNQKNLTNLQPGQYCVTVNNGCQEKTSCYTIVNCDMVQVNVTGSTEPTCQNYEAGAVNITVSGGAEPYKYKWSNGSPNKNLSKLTAGTYTVTVYDKNACTATNSFTVVTTQISIVDVGCTRWRVHWLGCAFFRISEVRCHA